MTELGNQGSMYFPQHKFLLTRVWGELQANAYTEQCLSHGPMDALNYFNPSQCSLE